MSYKLSALYSVYAKNKYGKLKSKLTILNSMKTTWEKIKLFTVRAVAVLLVLVVVSPSIVRAVPLPAAD